MELWPKCAVQMSLDGIVAVESDMLSEAQSHVRQFMGIFRLLTIHCLSERWVLEKLSYLVAVRSSELPATSAAGRVTVPEKDGIRHSLITLAKDLALYRSSMASEDCGGRHEYYSFFKQLRQAFDIAALKRELREDLHDTLAVLESAWMTERRAQDALERYWKKKTSKIEKRTELNLKERERRLDITIYTISAIVTPFVIIGSLFGMNNADTPRYVPWGYTLLGCTVVSVLLLVIIWVNFYRTGPRSFALAEEKLHYQRLHLGLLVPATDALDKSMDIGPRDNFDNGGDEDDDDFE